MKVTLEISDPYEILSKSDYNRLTERALVSLKRTGSYLVSLAVVDDGEIRKLNRRYRQQDKATDVLSFPFLSETDVGEFPLAQNSQDLGEIIISQATASRQAQAQGHSLTKELEILYVHGLLHLLGHDHKSDQQHQKMERLAAGILNS
ncbi:MAG: rRNA maturation RNase YbeY [Parcubacteria group bacterium]|nr:rRNA maturation RNase YbeY [Parcubacteria group bacterium]